MIVSELIFPSLVLNNCFFLIQTKFYTLFYAHAWQAQFIMIKMRLPFWIARLRN